eukprot:TRINITY_DN9962_c0_g2_i2.p2 TRINITY_DN9962_c0_g2~~TRINITY_DN9962_c0_g2_i2.p2  ORF type:complete len:207 (-),score=38.64 TRINITY_DN9962_c0_g2_i2:806-1426(-)
MSLINVFKEKKVQEQKDGEKRMREKLYPTGDDYERLNERNAKLAHRASGRYNNFHSEAMMDQPLTTALQKGAIPITPIPLYNFRDRDKRAEMNISPIEFRVRHYVKEDERAAAAEKVQRAAHLEREPYGVRGAYHRELARERDPSREIGTPFHFHARTENERICESVNENSIFDLAPREMRLYQFQRWRKDDTSLNYDKNKVTFAP